MKGNITLSLLGADLELPPGRLLLLVLIIAATGLLYFLWPASSIAESLQQGVLYLSLLALACFLFYGGRLAKDHYHSARGSSQRWAILLPAFIGCIILFLHADFGFKVSMDDAILSASAKSLYESQEYYVGIEGHHGANGYGLVSGYFDKRPWFYSFCIALMHYLSGWRVENAFIVNACFGAAFIFIIAACGKQLAGKSGAWIGAMLAASIPLVAQCATGGGMDMTNVALLALLFLLTTSYLNSPSDIGEGAVLSAAILLAYTRYESLLYVIPALLIVGVGWILRGRAILSLPTLISAPLLLPVLLQNRYFRDSEPLWELRASVQSPFGLEHIAENFPRALYFLFNLSDTLANSAIVSALGIGSFALIVVCAPRLLIRQWREHRGVICWAILTAAICLNFMILMAYHDGKLDKIFASRLALPLCVSLVLAPCALIGLVPFNKRYSAILIGIILVYIVGWTLPANSRELYTRRNYVQNELDWLIETIGPDVLEKDLVIDPKSTIWTLHEKETLRPRVALENLEMLAQRQADGDYENMYYIQRFEYAYGESSLGMEPSRLPAGVFDMQPLIQRSFRPFSVVRVSRVRTIHPDRLPEGFLNRPPHGQRQDYDYDGL